jgi:uncharacterized repeat protein (TIGR01451 family)
MKKRWLSFLIVFIFVFSGASFGKASTNTQLKSTLPATKPMITSQSDFFTENKGQWDTSILFVGNTPFGKIAFTKDAVYYQQIKTTQGLSLPRTTYESQTIKLSFVNPQEPIIQGVDLLPHYNNYFIGNDQSKWASNCRNFTKITYQDIWTGIDLAYFFTPEGLKYEYYVEPTADIKELQIQVEGATLQNQGTTLQLSSPLGTISDSNLKVFDAVNHNIVKTQFQTRDNVYSFQGIPEKRNHTLVIDPPIISSLSFSTFLGGFNTESSYGCFVDSAGNTYVTGDTSSIDFSITPGAFDSLYDNKEAFVSKLNSTGTSLIYSTYIGGSMDDYAEEIIVDSTGNAYIVGYTSSTNFPVTTGVFQPDNSGASDAFVTKLNPSGSALIFSTYLGSPLPDMGVSITIDTAGSIFVTGVTKDGRFPVTPNAIQSTNSGSQDVFVTKFNSTATSLVYSTFLGGNKFDFPYSIEIDSTGNAYVAGSTSSKDFPVTTGAHKTMLSPGDDCFISKLNTSGTSLVYSTFLGGTGTDNGFDLDLDQNGCAYITGYTESTDFPITSGVIKTTLDGSSDSFVTKLNSDGSSLVYSTFLGGDLMDKGNSIAVDTAGNAYVAGYTESTNFPVTLGYIKRILTGNYDGFVTKLNPSGTKIFYSTLFGGDYVDISYSISIDSTGNAYMTGITTSPDFPTTYGCWQSTIGSDKYDAFVSKISTLDVTLSGTLNFNINLNWQLFNSNGYNVRSFEIYRADALDRIFTLLANVDGDDLSYVDTTGEIGKTYLYYIVVLVAIGKMNIEPIAQSNTVTLGPITNISISLSGSLNHFQSNLSWAVNNQSPLTIKGYQIYRANTATWNYELLAYVEGATNLTYQDQTGKWNQTYSYYVVVIDENNVQAAQSNPVILGPIHFMDTTLAGSLFFHQVNLTWQVDNPLDYPIQAFQIYRGLPDNMMMLITTVPGTTFVYSDSTGTQGRSYLYQVVPVNASLEPLDESNQVLLGPIQAPPKPILSMSIVTNKTEFYTGEDVLYQVTIYNQGYAPATDATLSVTLPSGISYQSADRYYGSVQPSGMVIFALGTLPPRSQITFQINGSVSLRPSQEISLSTLFSLSTRELDTIQKTVSCIVKPKKSGDTEGSGKIQVKLLNLKYDPETGVHYLPLTDKLEMNVTLSGFTAPSKIQVFWGDGNTDTLTEGTNPISHQFTSRGTMIIRIVVTDSIGRTKEVTLTLIVR